MVGVKTFLNRVLQYAKWIAPQWHTRPASLTHNERFFGIWIDGHEPHHVLGHHFVRTIFRDQEGNLRIIDNIWGENSELIQSCAASFASSRVTFMDPDSVPDGTKTSTAPDADATSPLYE